MNACVNGRMCLIAESTLNAQIEYTYHHTSFTGYPNGYMKTNIVFLNEIFHYKVMSIIHGKKKLM